MSQSFTAKFMGGIRWGAFSTGANISCQFVFMAFMARLLDPATFGLIAMANISIRFLSYFAQLGVGPALVQKATLDEDDIQVAFTFSALTGVCFFGLLWVISPLAGAFFDNMEVVNIMRVLGLAFIITGLSTVSTALLRRGLKFKQLALIDTAAYIFGYGIVALICAFNGLGAWSLVFATLGQQLITFLIAYTLVRHSLRFKFTGENQRHFLTFGTRYSLIGFLEFLGSNLDSLVIGRVLGAAALGLYNRAFMLTNLSVEHPVNVITKVLFPMLCESQSNKSKTGKVFLICIFAVGCLTTAICFGMVPAAHDLILTLLGSKWLDSVPIAMVLAFSVPFIFLSHVCGVFCDAQNALRLKLIIQFFSLIVLAVFIMLFIDRGVIGFALAILAAGVVKFVIYLLAMRHMLAISSRSLFRVLIAVTMVGCTVSTAIWLTTMVIPLSLLPVAGRLCVEIVVGTLSLTMVLMPIWTMVRRLDGFQDLEDALPILRRLNFSNSV